MRTLDPARLARLEAGARRQLAAFLVAVQFLTRLPTPRVDLSVEAVRRDLLGLAPCYFPAVGALIGAITAGVILQAARVWPVEVAVALGLVAEALVTGAFHEDAVADFCDAFGGGWTRDDVLRILKDSRVGSFGVLGLGLAVALRGGATATLPADLVFAAVVAAAALGRWAILPAVALLPPLTDRASISRDVAQPISPGRLALGSGLALVGCLPLLRVAPGRLLLMVAAVAALVVGFTRYVRARIGGMTGDCLGGLCYLAQVVALLVASGRAIDGGGP